ncbi:hypothetical protein CHS0354_029401 [Potamilus streckersoni]|uniref:Uncharacterized protein n=1 Tax=Potamilus streckersoni TaxID=2493646 RepID=A0AAE0SUK3_9BIVA|nr:hypothetical protein CHS0354_029401 [Potamilus streckersoni]
MEYHGRWHMSPTSYMITSSTKTFVETKQKTYLRSRMMNELIATWKRKASMKSGKIQMEMAWICLKDESEQLAQDDSEMDTKEEVEKMTPE